MIKHDAPFLASLLKYAKENVYPFHTPGHKGGRGLKSDMHELANRLFTADVSLMAELDDIHRPQYALKKAQELAADVYKARSSFFCVNGTTGAIHAMLLGTLSPKDKVIVPRNAHRAVVGALVLADIDPLYVYPEYCSPFSLTAQVTPDSVEKILAIEKNVKAVLLTSPNYYGLTANVREISEIAKKYNALLLVDEAHGAHLGFCDTLPPNALSMGADVVAQSTHKLLGAMTQCSVLHVCSEKVDVERVFRAVSTLTTTSPNQMLLASLDAAICQLSESGETMMMTAYEKANLFRTLLNEISNLVIFEDRHVKELNSVQFLDKTKITVNVDQLGLTGFAAADFLRENGFAVELADPKNIVFLITYADDEFFIRKCADAMKTLYTMQKQENTFEEFGNMPKIRQIIPLREAFFAKREKLHIKNALNRVSAQDVTFYPPGIPLVMPGELITKEIADYIINYAKLKNEPDREFVDVVDADE